MSENKCHICDKDFSNPYTYRRHIKVFHGCVYEHMLTRGVPCSHPQCINNGIRFGNMEKYRQHLNDMHFIPEIMSCVEVSFQTYEGFVQWKLVQETRDKANYIVTRGAEKVKGGTKHVYGCNRSGSFQSKSTGKRQPKAHGTRKTGRTCPSMIVVHHVRNSWNVKYFPTHFGHEQQLEHLSISAKDRLEIADQLSKGVPAQRIVTNMQMLYGDTTGDRHLPTLKDVANVARAFGLDKELEADGTAVVVDQCLVTEPEPKMMNCYLNVERQITDLETANRQAYNVDNNPFRKILRELEELGSYASPDDHAVVAAMKHLMHAKRMLSLRRRKGAIMPLSNQNSVSGEKLTSPAYWMKSINKDRLVRQKRAMKAGSSTVVEEKKTPLHHLTLLQ